MHGCCTAVSVLEFVVGVMSGAGVVEGYIVKNVEVVQGKFNALD